MIDEFSTRPTSGRFNWQFARYIAASLLLTIIGSAVPDAGLSGILCIILAALTILLLIVRGVIQRGRRRSITLLILAIYLFASIAMWRHYSLVRDHARWLVLSGHYKSKLLTQAKLGRDGMKYIEWDGWGFAGTDTTVFLVLDLSDSLAKAVNTEPPVESTMLPCPVFRIRRLESHWYAVLFYTDTYWGTENCQ